MQMFQLGSRQVVAVQAPPGHGALPTVPHASIRFSPVQAWLVPIAVPIATQVWLLELQQPAWQPF
jgi:hypothetical protein